MGMIILPTAEARSALIVLLSVHSSGTKIRDLRDQLSYIVREEIENGDERISRNFTYDLTHRFSSEVESIVFNLIQERDICVGSDLKTYTILPSLRNLGGQSERDLVSNYNYSTGDLSYFKDLGRRLETIGLVLAA